MNTNLVRSRQAELVDEDILKTPITIIGAGAIGSFTALALAKVGFHRLEVYDDDVVSLENIANQFYRYADIGRPKVEALQAMLQDFEGISIEVLPERWKPKDRVDTCLVMAVDNMTTRQAAFANVRRSRTRVLIDGRMGGQQAEVYTVDLKNQAAKEGYEKYLYSEHEVVDLPCTRKSVLYNVLWISSTITNNLRLVLEGKPYPPVLWYDFENVVMHAVIAA